ncbi:hypothetical protein [Methanolobus sp. WCC4]|uniref:hypothetical protein n=1 Tax=Methanolobus sp. WCC4 TaxID=3125784 RepID=UPI0030FBC128
MTLPDVCPRDGVSQCKKKECHLYILEWRTGDEQCVIGYRSTHKELSRSVSLEDTYVENTRKKLEKKEPRERRPWPDTSTAASVREHLKREVPVAETRPETVMEPAPVSEPVARTSESYIEARVGKPVPEVLEQLAPVTQEEVVVNDKNTTVIEAKSSDEEKDKDARKRKSLDEVMDLDLPEDYEEKFWK